MSIRETLINALWRGNILPARGAELVDGHRRVVRAEVLAEAADAVAAKRTVEWDVCRQRALRSAEVKLRRMAQAGKDTARGESTQATRTRVFTHSFPGQPPHLTITLAFGPEYTDAGIEEISQRVRAAGRYGFKPVIELAAGGDC